MIARNAWTTRFCCLGVLGLVLFMPSWAEAQDTAQVGYARLQFDGSSVVPTGSAVFSYRNPQGVLVTEAGVAAVEVLERGRIFVDQAGTRTGLALVNPQTQSSAISFTLRDSAGTIVDSTNLVLEPGNHLARFVDELFSGMPAGFQGSVTFESLAGLGAITLRESQNSNQEPLYTTLPVANLDAVAGSGSLTFPHLAAGGGYLTQVLLINGTSAPAEGRIQFIGSDGLPLSLVLDGVATSEVSYQLAPDGVFSAELEGGAQVEVGYAVLTPEVGSTPSGSVLFEFTTDGQLISAAGVGATDPTTAAKIAIDNVGRQTGFALANPGLVGAEVEIRLQDRFGVTQQEESLTIAADGHIARLANEFFPTLSAGFNGLIEIESTVPIVSITLQITINSRGDLVLTTLPIADLAAPPISVETVFPQFVIGGGFSTRFVLIATAASGFNLTFHHTDGTPWLVPPTNESTIGFQLGAGQSVRTFPGNTAEIASISIRDPITNLETTELTLNQGSTLRPRVLITDTEGNARDDLLVNYTSFNPSVATVDAEGLIAGIGSGFSTLTVDGNGILATATISVVEFAQSTGGFATDVVQSGTGTLFVTSTGEHTILSLDNLQTTLYAGSHLQRGFLNDERLLSRFDGPSYLAIDRASGRLYVSDTENHAIRMVPPGATQSVTTLAGGGTPGFVDASSDAARFDTPKGVAIDSAGFLWVVDQANHVIRRINLGSGQVETVAGTPGVSGSQDGNGSAAGFNTPTGIAIEPESLAAQLLREAQGGTAPPIQVVVTDTGNGLIRRITENGDVSTVSSGAVAALSRGPDGRYRVGNGGVPLRFDSPTGIAVGPLGNIYVIESESGQIRSILPTGEVVTLAARGSFEGPNGLVVGDNGEIIVASTDTPLTGIRTAAPVITAINPASVSPEGGETVVVHGANFEPDAVLTVAEVPISFTFLDTSAITFVTPALPVGQASLSLTTRGGVALASFTVEDQGSIPLGFITTVAGGGVGDGGPATNAILDEPVSVTVDDSGNLYIGDYGAHRIRKVAPDGTISTVAGIGEQGFSGDGGPARAARLHFPAGTIVDASGNLYIADSLNATIRKVAPDGTISTVAGTGVPGYSGDGGPATAAMLTEPTDVALDVSGNLFIADYGGHTIRKVAPDGTISTVAGTGIPGFIGDGGPATAAQLSSPVGVVVDESGNLYIGDSDNHRIRKVAPDGTITTVAGTGQGGFSGDGGPATAASLLFPNFLALDASGNLYIADSENNRIRKVAPDGTILTVAGNGQDGFGGDGGPATDALIDDPIGVAVDASGNLYIADYGSDRIRKVAPDGTITTVAGSGDEGIFGDGGPATDAVLDEPVGVVVDGSGNLYIADWENHRVAKVTPDGTITTVAGTGDEGFGGDGGPATAAQLNAPAGMTLDDSGNLYIGDYDDHRIRKVAPDGTITTVAGTGIPGFSGDGEPATAAQLNSPAGMTIDASGNLIFADGFNNAIRKIAPDGTITTVAGTGEPGYSGDGGPATAAQLSTPVGLVLDASGNLYIADTENNRIRMIAPDGTITTVAGTGQEGFSGDGGPATAAWLNFPTLLALDASGNLYIGDTENDRIRKVILAQ